ncbi:unnamed protein product [Rhizoctonia solani]|uniref:PQ-loop-domain-containing protein n=1 Tax=Rhizoctonia solani TaxID=456999 RepID=A0A8H3CIT1_9AGAM|nr:unnamed protein product [Rhizoctonia solani]
MPVNEAAENILATIGTVLWTAQLVPQVVKSFREKSTEGLSPWLMFIWALSAWFLGVYAIVQNISIPIILQPQLFGALAALSWIQACLLPQYWEIWKRKEVVGVSMLFMSVDMLGGVFSVLSLVFQAQFDAVAAVSYVLVVVLDGVVVLAALILNPIAKRRREREDQSTVAPGEVSDLEIGQQLHEGRIVLAEAVAAVQSKHGPSPMKQIE